MARVDHDGCRNCYGRAGRGAERYDCPAIMNTDQGSQYTSERLIEALKKRVIKFSMDGKDAWRDNFFVERLCRSVKYEDVYSHAYETPNTVKQELKRYFDFYPIHYPHPVHTRQTPDRAYFSQLATANVA